MYDDLKWKVRKLRYTHGLTYGKIAQLTGYAEYTIASFMAGIRESKPVAEKLNSLVDELGGQNNGN